MVGVCWAFVVDTQSSARKNKVGTLVCYLNGNGTPSKSVELPAEALQLILCPNVR